MVVPSLVSTTKKIRSILVWIEQDFFGGKVFVAQSFLL